MAGAIGPGDFVECLASSHSGHVLKGRVYQVTRVEIDDDSPYECQVCANGADGVRRSLFFVELAADRAGWCPCRFRPVYRPNSEIIESLKVPSPSRELEDA